jgi:hypothetical protein
MAAMDGEKDVPLTSSPGEPLVWVPLSLTLVEYPQGIISLFSLFYIGLIFGGPSCFY